MPEQLEMIAATCRSCGAPVLWATVDRSSRRIPLDVAYALEPRTYGVIAYNPQTGGAHVVMAEDHHLVRTWQDAGVTFHRAHFATCPQADRWRVEPEAAPA